MKNYKDLILNNLKEVLSQNYKEIYEDISEQHINAIMKANQFVYDFMDLRFTNELKQYNNDSIKAHDLFVARKNLDYLRIYTEEILTLENNNEDDFEYIHYKKELRNTLNWLYQLIKKGDN